MFKALDSGTSSESESDFPELTSNSSNSPKELKKSSSFICENSSSSDFPLILYKSNKKASPTKKSSSPGVKGSTCVNENSSSSSDVPLISFIQKKAAGVSPTKKTKLEASSPETKKTKKKGETQNKNVKKEMENMSSDSENDNNSSKNDSLQNSPKKRLQVFDENSSSSDMPLSMLLTSKSHSPEKTCETQEKKLKAGKIDQNKKKKCQPLEESDSDTSLHSQSTVPLEKNDTDSAGSSSIMLLDDHKKNITEIAAQEVLSKKANPKRKRSSDSDSDNHLPSPKSKKKIEISSDSESDNIFNKNGCTKAKAMNVSDSLSEDELHNVSSKINPSKIKEKPSPASKKKAPLSAKKKTGPVISSKKIVSPEVSPNKIKPASASESKSGPASSKKKPNPPSSKKNCFLSVSSVSSDEEDYKMIISPNKKESTSDQNNSKPSNGKNKKLDNSKIIEELDNSYGSSCSSAEDSEEDVLPIADKKESPQSKSPSISKSGKFVTPLKKNGAKPQKKKNSKTKTESSNSESDSDVEASANMTEPVGMDNTNQTSTSASSSEKSESESENVSVTKKKDVKKSKKIPASDKKKEATKKTGDNPRIQKLQRYLKEAGQLSVTARYFYFMFLFI